MRAPTASTVRSKRLYTSHEYTVQVHSSKSYVNNTFVIHPAPSAARLTAEKRPPNGPREASAARPRSSPRTSRDRLPVSATSAASPVSSGKSKEASASTHTTETQMRSECSSSSHGDAGRTRGPHGKQYMRQAHASASFPAHRYAPREWVAWIWAAEACVQLGSRSHSHLAPARCAQGAQTCCRREIGTRE